MYVHFKQNRNACWQLYCDETELFELRQIAASLAVLEVRSDDICEGISPEQLVSKRHEMQDLSVQVRASERKHVGSEFETFAVVALVVGELNEHNYLHERVGRCVTLLVVFCRCDS